jgi:hypothetical protein
MDEFEVQRDEFDVVMQVGLRHAGDVAFLEGAGAVEAFAAPHRLGNRADPDLP